MGSWFMFHVPCPMFSRLMFYFPTDHVSCFIMTLVSCSMLHVSCLKSHASRPMSHVWYRRHETCMRHETRGLETRGMKKHEAWDARHETSCLLSLVSCLMPHASWLMFPVSCLLRYETWPPLPPWGEGGGDRRHEAWKHEPWATRSETWKLEPWKNTMHETRDLRHEL